LLGFGVGCITWEVMRPVPAGEGPAWQGAHSAMHHVRDRLPEMLAAIPSVQDVQVEGLGAIRASGPSDREPTDPRRVPRLHEGGPFWPHLASGSVKFSVNVPHRIQREVGLGVSLESEMFGVLLSFEGPFPTMFVSMSIFNRTSRPSTGIVIVREFLAREFEQRFGPDADLQMVTMGPSPFWLEGWVLADAGAATDLEVTWVKNEKRYDNLEVRHSGTMNERDVLELFATRHAPEFGLYYEVVSEGLREGAAWAHVGDQLVS
jgi:hypothetical protein